MKKLYPYTLTVKLLLLLIVIIVSTDLNGQNWTIVKIDSTINTSHLSLELDGSTPYIAYRDSDLRDLKLATWNGTYFNFETVDDDWVSSTLSLAINSSGQPCIAYIAGATENEIRYARWNGSSWEIEDTGLSPSEGWGGLKLAFDNADIPHLCFSKSVGSVWKLQHAIKNGTAWNEDEVDGVGGNIGSIAISSSGTIHMAYYDPYLYKIKYATGTAGSWIISEIDDIDQYSPNQPTIRLNSSGNPCVGYWNGSNAEFAEWDGSTWQKADVTAAYNGYTSMALNNQDNPAFTYYKSYTMHYAHWDGTTADIHDFEMISSTECENEIEVGTNNLPQLVYNNRYVYLGDAQNGIDNAKNSIQSMHIYPNPTTNNITVNFRLNEMSDVSYAITDITGKISISGIISNMKDKNILNIDVSELKHGIYFIQLKSKNGISRKKLVVQ